MQMQYRKANTKSFGERELIQGFVSLARETSVVFFPWANGVNATPSMEAKGKRRHEDLKPQDYPLISLGQTFQERNPRVYPLINLGVILLLLQCLAMILSETWTVTQAPTSPLFTDEYESPKGRLPNTKFTHQEQHVSNIMEFLGLYWFTRNETLFSFLRSCKESGDLQYGYNAMKLLI